MHARTVYRMLETTVSRTQISHATAQFSALSPALSLAAVVVGNSEIVTLNCFGKFTYNHFKLFAGFPKD